MDLGPVVHGITVAEEKDTKGDPIMKHMLRSAGCVVFALLLLSMSLSAFAADGPAYYDCLVRVYGVDAEAENIVSAGIGVQVQAGDGSEDTWAVASYDVTDGATYYAVTDAKDTDSSTVAELIASDADSGIAVFRLDSRIESCTAPSLATLDGISTKDTLAVVGLGKKGDSNYFFSRGVRITDLTTQKGYTVLSLEDGGDASLSEYAIYPIGVLMTNDDKVIGFYTGSYRALPSGYIMPSADGIGTLDTGNTDGGQTPSTGDNTGGTPDNGTSGAPEDSSGSVSFSTVETPNDVKELVEQAKSERRRSDILRTILVVTAVAAAGGIITFALLKSRKVRESAPVAKSAPEHIRPVQPMGKTEYVGPYEYREEASALPRFRVVPLPGTQGDAREIPSQGLTFGRDPACAISFPPDTGGVSSHHCSLTWSGGTLRLTDLGSSFGTLLEDGKKLSGTSADIKAGMCFYLGSRKIGFRVEEET